MSDYKKMLDEKINLATINHNKSLAYFNNASFDQVYRNGANLIAPMLLEAIEALTIQPIYKGMESSIKAQEIIRKFEEFCK